MLPSRPYGQCPNQECKYDCFQDMDDEPHLLSITNRHSVMTDYGPGENWTETWKCPMCQTVFHERNGYP